MTALQRKSEFLGRPSSHRLEVPPSVFLVNMSTYVSIVTLVEVVMVEGVAGRFSFLQRPRRRFATLVVRQRSRRLRLFVAIEILTRKNCHRACAETLESIRWLYLDTTSSLD